ncbi:MAG: dihydrofolate reductase [Gammaproteobacteria bacterium]|nr:dihydrofolate reductase [Gammaproteobacteria bacterium]
MKLSLIWAMSQNRVIGRAGQLPWNLPDEMRFFVEKTRGKPVIMGRKTFESIGKPLPNRLNIVVTSTEIDEPTVTLCCHVPEAIDTGRTYCTEHEIDELFIIGGSSIYRAALPLADKLYATTVHAHIEGDTFFPEYDESLWVLSEESHHAVDELHAFAFSIRVFERTNSAFNDEVTR